MKHVLKTRFGTKDLTEKQKMKYISSEYEITKNFEDSDLNKYAKNKLMEKIIKNCRGVNKCNDGVNRLDKEDQKQNFRILLGFKENEICERKEYSSVRRIKKIFTKQTIIEQYRVEKYFIDLFFPVHKLGIEIDENGHLGRSENKEQKREQSIKNPELILSELILIKKTLILMTKLVKYKILFMSLVKN